MASRTLSAEDVADWLTPDQAVTILTAFYGEPYLSKRTLLGRLTGGMVQAVSNHTVIDDSHPARRILHYLFQSSDWNGIETTDTLWITGDLIYRKRSYGGIGDTTYRHYGVRFEPQGIQAIVANAPPPKPASPPKLPLQEIQGPGASNTNKGGAPRKEWWDDFWILKPISQADLERAMLDWAAAHSHDMSESSAKVVARKLFKAWKLGDKN